MRQAAVAVISVWVGPMSSLALYIHVPFCGQRCAYCHFDIKVLHPRSDPAAFELRYLDALQQELNHYAGEYGGRSLSSVFLGGGTPSRLPLAALTRLTAAVRAAFAVDPDCEWSMEVNPEDAHPTYLNGLAELGFTRLSFGVQTFDDRALAVLKRPHDGAGAQAVLAHCARLGLPHGFSLDLMLGLPYQTEATLARDLDVIAALQPPHVSVYMLETDLPTSLDKTGRGLPMPDEDDQAEWYERVVARLAALGLAHYEISNFARPGFACRHNLTYWQRGDYLGLGPAAHGFVGACAWANHERLNDWQAAVARQGHGRASEERWSAARCHNEVLLQGMRLLRGIDPEHLSVAQRTALKVHQAADLLQYRDKRLALTVKGCLLANEVFTSLLDS